MNNMDYQKLLGQAAPVPAGRGAQAPAEPGEPESGAGAASGIPAEGDNMTQAPLPESGEGPGVAEEGQNALPAEPGTAALTESPAAAEARLAIGRELDGMVVELGLTNPYTGRPIASAKELLACRQRQAREKLSMPQGEAPGNKGFPATPEAGRGPEELQAREKLPMPQGEGRGEAPGNRGFSGTPEAGRRLAELQVQQRINREIQEISRVDPRVKGVEDLSRVPGQEKVWALINKGYSLADAWKIVNFEDIARRSREAARQEARNAVESKSHLSATSARGKGAATVPAEVAAEYRQLVPDATDSEIQKHYNSYVKRSLG